MFHSFLVLFFPKLPALPSAPLYFFWCLFPLSIFPFSHYFKPSFVEYLYHIYSIYSCLFILSVSSILLFTSSFPLPFFLTHSVFRKSRIPIETLEISREVPLEFPFCEGKPSADRESDRISSQYSLGPF